MDDSPQKPLREGGYRPIGGALRAGVREDEPQRLRRFAHASVVERPRAVSGCLTLAAIVIHRLGTGASSAAARGAATRSESAWAWDRTRRVARVATDDVFDLTTSPPPVSSRRRRPSR